MLVGEWTEVCDAFGDKGALETGPRPPDKGFMAPGTYWPINEPSSVNRPENLMHFWKISRNLLNLEDCSIKHNYLGKRKKKKQVHI